jgi:2-iminobutanoate/2-iminopropanoate deaminase
MNIYITNMENFALVNEAYDEFFTWSPKPVSRHKVLILIARIDKFQARTCVAVFQLPLGTDVEIECTAFLD